MEVVLLSQYPELLDQCANLLNKQWKRSVSARIQSLEKSYTYLPDSLLLLENNESGKSVIGHSRLSRVLEDPYGCWIGSVVISEEKRKKGYGKYLMAKTEEYARTFQFITVYLNTHDQQGFYEHLGYTYCDPVSSIGFTWNGFNPQSTFYKISDDYQNKNHFEQHEEIQSCTSSSTNNQISSINAPPEPPSPPPPPPPPPPSLNKNSSIQNNLKTNLGHYWMKKKL